MATPLNEEVIQCELDVAVKDDQFALIPDAQYEVVCTRYEKRKFFGAFKLYVWFRIITEGDYQGLQIFRAYNWYERPPRGSDLFKDLGRLYGRPLRKNTRLSLKLFKEKALLVQTRTIRVDRKQNPLPEYQRYSVVDRLIDVVTGGSNDC